MTPLSTVAPLERPRFLSDADCHDIAQRLARSAVGGGKTEVRIVSTWTGNVRWARNVVSTSGEDRDNHIFVDRRLNDALGRVQINDVSEEALVAANRQAERLARLVPQSPEADLTTRPDSPFRSHDEPFPMPPLFSDATYQLDAEHRAEAARALAQSATDAGMLSAGYLEVSAHSTAYLTSWGYTRYFQYTWAQYSVTVRDPKGIGSGWAGVDWPDWSKIDGPTLSALALDKCLQSRNPVAIEPGRYTAILEPQAVGDFIGNLMSGLDRWSNERSPNSPFNKDPMWQPTNRADRIGQSLLGERVVDERITVSADPMDPELGFPPFRTLEWADSLDIYHPATWIEHGVLKALAYDKRYAIERLGRSTGLPNSGAFRMSGGNTSLEEMIATTARGLLVTRFDEVQELDGKSMLCHGYTRDGLWLIENGKISKAVKNMLFVESVLFALNNVEQLGPPQRVFHPPRYWFENPKPVIVPPLKIKDFSFTALSESI